LKNQASEIQNQETRIKNQFSIKVESLSKKFNREWIFKNLNYTFESGYTYALTGPNGSGKSTLLQILWGQLPQTSGSIEYTSKNSIVPIEEIFNHVAIATPYMDLIEEFTLLEQLEFHFRMRPMRPGLNYEKILDKLYLSQARDKNISNFSSGMKQRLKLGLAFYSMADALFLDEPGTNLDSQAFAWYKQNVGELPVEQLVIIASNQSIEYPESAVILNMNEIK
jgi:ABC-type multidrug transport system ATPase subunit